MSSVVLPEGWCDTKLGAVVEYGKAVKKELSQVNNDTWILELEDIEKDNSKLIQRILVADRPFKSTKNSFSKGDVLYGKLRPYLNKIIIADTDGVCTTEIIPINGEPLINNKFMFYWLKSESFLSYVNAVSYGVNMPRLGTTDGLAAPFYLAPLAEQKVIAEKLDELLAQVDILKTRLTTIPTLLKRFRQSVLAAAVSGRLTEEWRSLNPLKALDVNAVDDAQFASGSTQGNFGKKNDRSPPISSDEIKIVVNHVNGWPLIRVGAVCQSIVPNRDKPKTFSGGYHWLLTPHFSENSIYIDYEKIQYGLSEEEVVNYHAKVIDEGNVIMTCVGRVGLSAVISEKSVINQQLHAFVPNEYIVPEYLAYCIRANVRYYETKATSTTVSYLNKTSCNSLPIPLPPLEEQTEIVRRVEQLFAFADQIEQQVKNAQNRVNNLTQSILAKAFRGELTADWRAANPDLITGQNSAQALLAKIKAEREKPQKTTKQQAMFNE